MAQGTVNGLSQCSGRGRGLPGASCVCPEEKGYFKKSRWMSPLSPGTLKNLGFPSAQSRREGKWLCPPLTHEGVALRSKATPVLLLLVLDWATFYIFHPIPASVSLHGWEEQHLS